MKWWGYPDWRVGTSNKERGFLIGLLSFSFYKEVVLENSDLLLYLLFLHDDGKIEETFNLIKSVFLIQADLEELKSKTNFSYEYYRFGNSGVFNKSIVSDMSRLENHGLVDIKTVETPRRRFTVFSLSRKGKKRIKGFNVGKEVRNTMFSWINKFKKMDKEAITEYIYETYDIYSYELGDYVVLEKQQKEGF